MTCSTPGNTTPRFASFSLVWALPGRAARNKLKANSQAKAPIPNLQAPEKLQAPGSNRNSCEKRNVCECNGLACLSVPTLTGPILGFGIWDLRFPWSLEFG